MTNLRESLEREKEKYNHISIGVLQRLVTESSVRECLSSAKIPLGSDLVSRIVSHCPKMFAILVLLQMEHYMTNPWIQNLSDSIFSVAPDEVPPFGSENIRAGFYEAQWCIPPRIDVKRHLKFPRNTILPFVRNGDQRNGSWGLVDKVTMLEGHLAGWREVGAKH